MQRECGCGCGEPTRMYRGEPRSFIHGHQTKGRKIHRAAKAQIQHSNGYVLLRMPDHPRAHRGLVYEHVLVAERALGKPLPRGSEVHHVNENTSDNEPVNLVLCQDRAYHALLHRRSRALNACGHADWLRCQHCHEWGPPEDMRVVATRDFQAAHPECARLNGWERRARRGQKVGPAPTARSRA